MVKWLRHQCNSDHHLTGYLYCNGNRRKWLYGHSDYQCNKRRKCANGQHHRFNKSDLYHYECNKDSEWWRNLSMVKWLRHECNSDHHLPGYIYCNRNRYKWLYGHSYDKCNKRRKCANGQHHRFNKSDLYHYECNKDSKWWRNLSMVKWFGDKCNSDHHIPRYIYSNRNRRKRLYSYSDYQRNKRRKCANGQHIRQ
jgi:hypothetical protein